MVVVNDFEFQLVSAEDKQPFQEHQKGGKTYVEVEPDAEYYLGIRKVRQSSARLKCEYIIDGKNLGYNRTIGRAPNNMFHTGLVSWSKGVEQNKALKFVKASFTSGDEGIGSTMAGMGTIELKVSTAIYDGQYARSNFTTSFTTPTIKMEDQSGVTMKKNVRSDAGSCVETSVYGSNETYHRYRAGEHLYSITLYYCATPGLIAVGVLPKPPAWEWQRMTKPSKLSAEEKQKLDNTVISEKRNRNGNLILQLADSDSDSDNEDETSVRPDPALSKHKKAKR